MSGKLPEIPVSPCPDCFCAQFFQCALFILVIFVTPAAITASGVAVPFESSPRMQRGLLPRFTPEPDPACSLFLEV